jgi:uncharacterized membrane protein
MINHQDYLLNQHFYPYQQDKISETIKKIFHLIKNSAIILLLFPLICGVN